MWSASITASVDLFTTPPDGLALDQGACPKHILAFACSYLLEAKMTRLMMILFSMISTTLMGVGMIVALVMGYDTLNPLLVAIAIGFVVSFPASWFVAKQITG